ncbi:MAG: undecaprenyl-diphosphate phosphatase [Deltaproteobacteria bacterium]|nr:undecaprenyl-diphosphate phosphatase [Deltaproteobacteria bacterium]
MPAESVSLAESIALGVIQGATEFLPVSSDGHLAIGAMVFGWQEMPLPFSVLLHAGTFVATLILLRHDVRALLSELVRCVRSPRRLWTETAGKTILAVVVASIPTAVIGFLLKDFVEPWSGNPLVVAGCLVWSAINVGSTRFVKEGEQDALSPSRAFLVGIAQGLAVLPGLSRSGSTIAVAMWLGLRGRAAFSYSFLLSLPAVGGAIALEMKDAHNGSAFFTLPVLVGALTAFGVGVAALLLLRKLVDRGRIWVFALYLVPLAIAVLVVASVAGGAR